MAARTSVGQVTELVETSIPADTITGNFIATANAIVNEQLVGKGISDDMLERIEMYLAAHLVTLSEERGGITRDRMGDSDTSYAQIYGSGLNSTRFGQIAVLMDTTGTLASIANVKPKAQFRVV